MLLRSGNRDGLAGCRDRNQLLRLARRVRRVYRRLRTQPDLRGLVADGLTLGEDVFIGAGTLIDPQFVHLITIGSRTTISLDVLIVAHDASTKRPTGYSRSGRVTIGEDVFIGVRSVILPNVSIGARAIVAAGSVVSRDVAEDTMVAGNPARDVGSARDYVAHHRAQIENGGLESGDYVP